MEEEKKQAEFFRRLGDYSFSLNLPIMLSQIKNIKQICVLTGEGAIAEWLARSSFSRRVGGSRTEWSEKETFLSLSFSRSSSLSGRRIHRFRYLPSQTLSLVRR